MRQLRSAIYANEPPALTEAIKRTGGAQGLLAGSVVGLPLLLAMEKARRELNEHFFANRDQLMDRALSFVRDTAAPWVKRHMPY
jgi:hypothetical protein